MQPLNPAPKKTILLVEDNPTCRGLVAHSLKHLGYKVLIATDGSEAANMVRAGNPDLMVLDLGLVSEDPFSGPNWDGFGVMAYMHHRKDRPIPIVVLSAADPNTAKAKALALGATAFFSKPPRPEFFTAIEELLAATSDPS